MKQRKKKKKSQGFSKVKALALVSVVLAVAGVIFLFSQHRGTPALNTVDIRIPLEYTQPLVIATFDFDFRITPREARAAEREELAENRFRYIDAYPNTDVVQTRETNKLKEDIILKSPGHPEKFSYDLGDISQYEVVKEESGDLVFYATENHGNETPKGTEILRRRFTIPAPFMIDAQGKKSSTKDVHMTYENGVLTLTPSKEWLAIADYPVTLDPTVEIHVLNVQSYPTVGSPWEVQFTTLGTETLTISGDPENTVYDQNVQFSSLKCGQEERIPIRQGNSYVFEGWSCEEIATFTVTVLTEGDHHQVFQFGDPSTGSGQIDHAYNHTLSTSTWWNTSWTRRRKITFANSAREAFTNYPVLIALTSSRIDWAQTQNSGQDIRFVDSDDATQLDHEIEEWNETGTDYVWVRVPTLDQSNTDYIWMYYGNASAADGQNKTGVWDSNFKGVWHLPNGVTLGALDSTSNANNGTINGAVAGSGKIDGAGSFDGTNDDINAGSAAVLDNISPLTYSAWINPSSLAFDEGNIAGKAASSYGTMFSVGDFFGASTVDSFWLRINFQTTTLHSQAANGALTTGTWYYVVGTWAGGTNTAKLYKNGAEVTYQTQDAPVGTRTDDSTGNFFIGARANTDIPFSGSIDEVRVSNSVRSANWIDMEYDQAQDTVNTYGSEESQAAPTITSVTDSPDPVGAGDAIAFSVDWNDTDSGETVKAKICKTNALSAQNCTGGSWATSTAFTTSDPESVSYTTSGSDVGAQNYYAFVCDQHALCSSSTSGTFTVQSATPSITSVTDTPDPTNPGRSVSFIVDWSDANSGETLKAKVCKTDALSAQNCTGGFWATSTAFTTLDPEKVVYDVVAGDAGQTRSYYVYVCDDNGNCNSSGTSGTFSVNAVSTVPNIKVRGGLKVR